MGGVAGFAFTGCGSSLVVELVDDTNRSDSVRDFSRGGLASVTLGLRVSMATSAVSAFAAVVDLAALDFGSSAIMGDLLFSGDFFTVPEANNSGKPEILNGLE